MRIAGLPNPFVEPPDRPQSDGILHSWKPRDPAQRAFAGDVLRVIKPVENCHETITNPDVESDFGSRSDEESVKLRMIYIVVVSEPHPDRKSRLRGSFVSGGHIEGRTLDQIRFL